MVVKKSRARPLEETLKSNALRKERRRSRSRPDETGWAGRRLSDAEKLGGCVRKRLVFTANVMNFELSEEAGRSMYDVRLSDSLVGRLPPGRLTVAVPVALRLKPAPNLHWTIPTEP